MTSKSHCKAAAKSVDAWARPPRSRAKCAPHLHSRVPWESRDYVRRLLPSERDFTDLASHVASLKPLTPSTQRLQRHVSDLVERLSRIRLLGILIAELNKTMSVDETMTPEIGGYKLFRNGLFSLEIVANLARYEAHVVREIEATAALLRMHDIPLVEKNPISTRMNSG